MKTRHETNIITGMFINSIYLRRSNVIHIRIIAFYVLYLKIYLLWEHVFTCKDKFTTVTLNK